VRYRSKEGRIMVTIYLIKENINKELELIPKIEIYSLSTLSDDLIGPFIYDGSLYWIEKGGLSLIVCTSNDTNVVSRKNSFNVKTNAEQPEVNDSPQQPNGAHEEHNKTAPYINISSNGIALPNNLNLPTIPNGIPLPPNNLNLPTIPNGIPLPPPPNGIPLPPNDLNLSTIPIGIPPVILSDITSPTHWDEPPPIPSNLPPPIRWDIPSSPTTNSGEQENKDTDIVFRTLSSDTDNGSSRLQIELVNRQKHLKRVEVKDRKRDFEEPIVKILARRISIQPQEEEEDEDKKEVKKEEWND